MEYHDQFNRICSEWVLFVKFLCSTCQRELRLKCQLGQSSINLGRLAQWYRCYLLVTWYFSLHNWELLHGLYGLGLSLSGCCSMLSSEKVRALCWSLVKGGPPLLSMFIYGVNINSSTLLIIMFHALLGRFQLELFYLFFNRRPTHWNSNCQLHKLGDRINCKTYWKCCVNEERPPGNKTQLLSGRTVEK